MAQERSTVLWNKKISDDYYYMGLKSSVVSANAAAGQFVMVRAADRLDPLLRRPFSIHQLTQHNDGVTGFELLYKVVGFNTRVMAGMKPGETVDVVGPLGNGFTIKQAPKKVAIVAGGIGVAPVVFLLSELISMGMQPEKCNVFLGGRNKEHLLCTETFLSYNASLFLATDDGSLGEKGLVTDLLEKELAADKPDIIYACGPHPMLKAVADIAEKNSVPCEVSIETIMACGMGACMGCAVEKRETGLTYSHVCINGPVFDSKHLVL